MSAPVSTYCRTGRFTSGARLRATLWAAVTGMLAICGSTGFAANRTWDGDTSAAWGTAGNWDAAPVDDIATDTAVFDLATYDGVSIFAPDAGIVSIAGLYIGPSNGAMTLSGTQLTIGGGGIRIATGAGAFSLSSPVTLGAAQSWINDSASLFTASGAVTNGGYDLTIGGSGNTTIAVGGNITGVGGLIKSGSGNLIFLASNDYSGATTIDGGILKVDQRATLANTDITVNPGATFHIRSTGSAHLANLVIGDAEMVTLNSGTFIMETATTGATYRFSETIGTLSYSGVSTVRLQRLGANSPEVFLTASSLVREGRAVLVVTAEGDGGLLGGTRIRFMTSSPADAPSYSGSVTEADRKIMLAPQFVTYGKTGAPAIPNLGNTTIAPTFVRLDTTASDGFDELPWTAATTPLAGASLDDTIAYDVTADVAITNNQDILALRLGAFNVSGAGTVTLKSGGLIINNLATTGKSAANNIDFDGREAVIYVQNDGGTAAYTLCGTLTSGDGLTLAGRDPGSTLVISGAGNSFGTDKPVTIHRSTLRLAGGADRLPTGSLLEVGWDGTLDLNDQNQTVALLKGVGNVRNGGSGTSTFAVDSITSSTFNGVIGGGAGTLNFAKLGSGSLALNAANTFSGGTLVEEGQLEALGNGSLGSTSTINITGGTLLLNKAGGGPANTVNDSAGITLGNSSGTPGVLKFGSDIDETVGVLTLSGNSTIDLYKLGAGSVIRFADSSGTTWSGNLTIHNWQQSGGINTRVFFGGNATALTGAQLGQIEVFSDSGSTSLGAPSLSGSGELVFTPIPEPGTVAIVLLLGLLLAWRERGTLSVLVFRRRSMPSA